MLKEDNGDKQLICYRQLSSNSKVRQFGMSLRVEEDVSCLDVAMDLPHEVKVLETLQRRLQDSCNLVLCQLMWQAKWKCMDEITLCNAGPSAAGQVIFASNSMHPSFQLFMRSTIKAEYS